MTIAIKRVYEPTAPDDGFRVLVDRVWPRGMTKERARLDAWLKEVAPSTALRTWFHHDTPKWDAFIEKYHAELAENPAVAELAELVASHPKVTILYGARDERHNQAVVLAEYLARR